MPKKQKSAITGTAPHSLCALAGFPRSVTQSLQGAVHNATKEWRVAISAFSDTDSAVYQSERAIGDLMRQVCEFGVERVIKNESNELPAPKRIVLCYIDCPNTQNLISAFGHSVLPLKLDLPNWDWPSGKHWRFFTKDAADAIISGLAVVQEGEFADFKLRLEAARAIDELMLPGRNFRINGAELLSDRYLSAAMGQLTWAEIGEGLEARDFNNDNLGSFFKRVNANKKRFYIDSRELVFPISTAGQHGYTQEIKSATDLSCAEMRRWLEGLFRFGTPLRSGFQHDVQRESNKLLNKQKFSCAERGEIEVSGSHANVYANDVIRDP